MQRLDEDAREVVAMFGLFIGYLAVYFVLSCAVLMTVTMPEAWSYIAGLTLGAIGIVVGQVAAVTTYEWIERRNS